MKALTFLVVVGLAVGLVLGGTGKTHTKMPGKTHQVTTEVISVDAKAKTVTIKDENGQPKTVPVMGKAVAQMATLKAGEKITVTCKDNEKGEHQGIVGFKPAKPASM